MTLAMQLLGPPRVDVDGEPLQVDIRKAVALLAYLAVEGGAHPRDRLADLFWPDAHGARARSSLRRTLSTARTALGGRWLRADRQVVRLDVDRAAVDVLRLTDALARHEHAPSAWCASCVEDLGPPVASAGRDFLEGLVVRGSAPFEQWVLATGERLRQRLDDAAARLVGAHAAHGDVAAAVAAARRRVDLDPLREDATRALMVQLARAGDRVAALEAYRRLVVVLDAELGVRPLDETVALHRAVLEGTTTPARPASARPSRRDRAPTDDAPDDGRSSVDPPLVGRDVELTRLRDLLDRRGALVVVEAASGMGRSRVLRAVAADLRTRGRHLVTASGSRGAAEIPYGVLCHALSPVVQEVQATDLPERVVVELGRIFPTLPPGTMAAAGTKAALYGALAHLVRTVSGLTLVLDDLHLADDASVEALCFLSADPALDLRVLAAVDPDDASRGRPRPGVDDLRTRGAVLPLAPLDDDAVATLAAHLDACDVDVARLRRETRGVPLLVVEALRSPAGQPVADTLRRAFEQRLRALPGTARQVLDVLATLGTPTAPTMVRAVAGRTTDEVDDALDVLVAARLVVEHDGAVEVAYAPLARLVAELQTPPRRRSVHRRCARALAAVDGEPIRIARHHHQAGDDAEAATWFERAGDAARRLHAHDEAREADEAALAAGHPDRGRLHARIGASAMHAGDYQAAIDHLETALALTSSPAVELELGVLHRRLRRWDLAAAHLGRIDVAFVQPDVAGRTLAELAVIERHRGDAVRAGEMAARALERAAASADPDVLAVALNAAALVDGDERVARLREARSWARDPAVRVVVLNNLAASLLDDDVEAAVEHARAAVELADDVGDRHVAAAVHNTLADAYRRAGLDPDARREVRRAVELFAGVATDAPDLDPDVWLLADL